MNKISQFLVLGVCALFLFSCVKEDATQPPSNDAPSKPSKPNPANGATNVSRSPVLSWTSSDPDAGDRIKYTIYVDTINPPIGVGTPNWIPPNYSLTGLDTNRTYYWKITAKDSKGASSAGPIWRFTTVVGIPTQDLVAYYPFNGNANDESGNGWNGTVNGAILTQDRFGAVNSAYHFNDTTTNSITTQFPGILGSHARTFSFWEISNEPTHSYAMSYGAGATFLDSSGVTFPMGIQKKTTTIGTVYVDLRFGALAYMFDDSSTGWHHYCFVVPDKAQPRTEDIRIYMDGRELTHVFYNTGSVVVNTLPGLNFTMGQFDSSANFGGDLDDIRVYNRALSNSEIQSLYHEGGW